MSFTAMRPAVRRQYGILGAVKNSLVLTRGFAGSSSSNLIRVDNPYSGDIVAEVPHITEAQATEKIGKAKSAFQEWRRRPLSGARIEAVQQAMKAFEAREEEIAAEITQQMGKPLKQAKGEVATMLARARAVIAQAPAALADRTVEYAGLTGKRRISYEPIGPVLVLAPWNYPLLCTVNVLIPALLAGNSVLIKHSNRTPLVADRFAQCFEGVGPKDLVQTFQADHDLVAKSIAHPDIAYVSFTGSVAGGHAVYKAAAQRFIDAGLELGGCDGAYVAPDADLAKAADGLIDGAFYNAGQSCCGIQRIYVHRAVYDKFLEASLKLTKDYVMGDPMAASTNMGPLAQQGTASSLEAVVNEAKSKGARVLYGGQATKDKAGKGRFFAPTLLADCNHDMRVMREECFGPVVGVCPVDSEAEAVKLINDNEFGLTAAVYTSSDSVADSVGRQLDVGTVFRNRCDFLDPYMPWSGRKNSGKGISLSYLGFHSLTRTKSYVIG